MSEARVILDTNVVSYIMKGGLLAEAYAKHLQDRLLAISFVTVGELYFGAEKARWGDARRARLETTLRNYLVIPYDHEIAQCFGRVVAEREREGLSTERNDAWIAACAVRHTIPLVTHNPDDFRGVSGLTVITELQPGT